MRITKALTACVLSAALCIPSFTYGNGKSIKFTNTISASAADLSGSCIVIGKPYGSVKNSQSIAAGSLERGKKYYSPNGMYYVIFQNDGNLVVYDNAYNKATWSTGTHNKGATRCIFQPHDGNFVVYGEGKALWDSSSYGYGATELRLSNTGELFVYNKDSGEYIWSNQNYISTTRSLRSGQCLSSPSGRYRAIMQTDGNFVIYKMHDNTVMWNSKTAGYNGANLKLNRDGSVDVGSKKVIASTPYGGSRTHTLTLDNNGRIIVRDDRGLQTWTSYPDSIQAANSAYPYGILVYNGAVYSIQPKKLSSWQKYGEASKKKYGISLSNYNFQLVANDNDSVPTVLSPLGTIINAAYQTANNYFLTFELYHNSQQNALYAVIKASDSAMTRYFDTKTNTYNNCYTGNYKICFDGQHSKDINEAFLWCDAQGNRRMNLFEYDNDKTYVKSGSFWRQLFFGNGTSGSGYNVGFKLPSLKMPTEYNNLLNDLLNRRDVLH